MQPLLLLLAGGAHTAPPLIDLDGTLFLQLGIFLVLLVVLNRLVFRPYMALRSEQLANTEGAREIARQEVDDAARRLAEYEETVLAARKDAALRRLDRRAEAEREAQELIKRSQRQAAERLDRARRRLFDEAPRAKEALQKEAADLAKAAAARVLGRAV